MSLGELMSLLEAIVKESKEVEKGFEGEVAMLGSDIIYSIIRNKRLEETEMSNDCERVIQVSNFIFSNSMGCMDLREQEELIIELLRFALSLRQFESKTSKEYFLEIILLIILHIKQTQRLPVE